MADACICFLGDDRERVINNLVEATDTGGGYAFNLTGEFVQDLSMTVEFVCFQ